MAYEPDETNSYGAIAKRGFAHEGLGYAAGQWFYGTLQQFEALWRIGVFGFEYPLWLFDALRLDTYGQTQGLDPRASWIQLGDIWGCGYSARTRVASGNPFAGRAEIRGIPQPVRPYNWWQVFNEQHHVIA